VKQNRWYATFDGEELKARLCPAALPSHRCEYTNALNTALGQMAVQAEEMRRTGSGDVEHYEHQMKLVKEIVWSVMKGEYIVREVGGVA